MPKTIAVEAESPDDSATMFRLRIDDLIVGQDLTAAQAHLLVGEILERVVLPRFLPSKPLIQSTEEIPQWRRFGATPKGMRMPRATILSAERSSPGRVKLRVQPCPQCSVSDGAENGGLS